MLKSLLRPLYWFPLFYLLSGCAGADRSDPGSPYWRPPVGSVVQLHRELTVRPGAARVFLQQGKVVGLAGLDQSTPSCNFELEAVSEQPQVIAPGSFLVTRVWGQRGEIVQDGPGRLAGAMLAESTDNGGTTMILHQVHLRLQSQQQPGVRNLTCRGGLDEPWLARPPSVQDMQQACGEVVTLHLGEQAGGLNERSAGTDSS